MASLALRALRKTYPNGTTAVHDISLQVADGEFVVLVGPSGCGKSTTLRMIAGLEEITSGQLLIGDEDVTDRPPAQRGLAMVFQSYALYPHMTVAQNMGFALKLAGLDTLAVRAKVEHAANVLQIGPLLARTPRELSGGQRQRVAIGRAIVREPGVFLFDEPLSNLDAALRGQMRLEMARLHQALGATIVYVTHDQVEAMTLGSRIAVFNGGRIEQVGAPLALYHRPATRFVAEFLGSPTMNFLPVRHDGHALLSSAAPDALLPWPAPAPAGELVLGLRPEHLPPAADGAEGTAQLTLQVEHREHLGDLVIAHGRLGDGRTPLTVKALAAQAGHLLPGARVRLRPDLQHAVLFDAQGRALPRPA
ncbi:MAG: sn-glycerol-3-phosphate ABC transporter ATP-binding protein UgpC [Burkholderiales bacterium]|nr:sn-glycerol-3-phosphate ABC transporter ATP-binding protein UgpC [Burkholderiales bacterium]